MPVIAYLANEFPSPVEPYVGDEIRELRRRGAEVICCSVRRPKGTPNGSREPLAGETLFMQPFRIFLLARAAWLCLREGPRSPISWRDYGGKAPSPVAAASALCFTPGWERTTPLS